MRTSKTKCFPLLFLLCGSLFACRPQQTGITQIDDAGIATPQPANERLVEGTLENLYPNHFTYPDSVSLNPTAASRSPHGIAVIDFPDRIAVLDTNGIFQHHMGAEPGQGPGELKKLNAIRWMPDGAILVADAGNQKIVRFQKEGTFEAEFALPTMFGAAAFLREDVVVTHYPGNAEGIFQSFTPAPGRVQEGRAFGWLLTNAPSPMLGLAMVGYIAEVSGDTSFVFVPLYAGKIARYGAQGHQMYYTNTIDDAPYPDIQTMNEEGVFGLREKHGLAHMIVSANPATLYIYRHSSTVLEEAPFYIDVYRTSDGHYLRSILHNNPACAPLDMDEHEVWLQCKGQLVRRWKEDA